MDYTVIGKTKSVVKIFGYAVIKNNEAGIKPASLLFRYFVLTF